MSEHTKTWVMKVVQQPPFDKAGHMADLIEGRVTTTYLRTFHPDRHGGRGEITFTDAIEEARRFDSFEAVMECWKTQSRVKPLRPDGKPNRPLTAYTIQPELAP